MQPLYKPQVLKQLKKLPSTEQTKILKKINQMMVTPMAGKNLKGELAGLRPMRAWPYRIIYQYDNHSGKIIVYSVAHRQGAYG